jgi:hypothetical protein
MFTRAHCTKPASVIVYASGVGGDKANKRAKFAKKMKTITKEVLSLSDTKTGRFKYYLHSIKKCHDEDINDVQNIAKQLVTFFDEDDADDVIVDVDVDVDAKCTYDDDVVMDTQIKHDEYFE